jgi:quercetin dioxygenase-like cupin family protein
MLGVHGVGGSNPPVPTIFSFMPVEDRGAAMNPKKEPVDANALAGRTFRAAGLVEYQDGAIVSREIVHGKAGTVTVFAFDNGQQLSEHTAPFEALVMGLDGAAEIAIAGRTHALKAGEVFVMPAGIPHALRAVSRFKMLLVMVKK